MKKNKVRVYDTISKKVVEVEVDDEIYTNFKRTKWATENNNRTFYEHEIQFSALIGGRESAFENFKEFKTDYDVEKETDRKMIIEESQSRKGGDFMFYTLILENRSGEQINMTTTANQYMTAKIDGLYPPAGTISTSTYAGMNGSYLNNAFIEKRNVVISFQMRGRCVGLILKNADICCIV